MPRRTAALVAALAALAVVPAAAHAGRPGVWTPITSADGDNIDQVGLVRAPDDVLHVAWSRKTPGDPVHDDLLQTLVTPAGNAGAAQTIAGGWVGIGAPQIARAADGALLIAAGATQTTDLASIASIAAWRSPDGGGTWEPPVRATPAGGFSDDAGLAFGSDGLTPFVAWGSTYGLFVHRGLDPAAPAGDFQAGFGSCCGYSPGLALDGASKQLVVAWHSNASGHVGVWAQQVDQATGSPIGAPASMPGSTTRYAGRTETSYSIAHTPIVGRPGRAGVWLAYEGNYPSTTRVVVWRYGAPKSSVIATRAAGIDNVGIAVTPEGRLWVSWSGGRRIYARRSNPSGTAWGAITSAPVPRGTVSTFHLAGNAQSGLLDLFGSFGRASPGVQTSHTQLRAGLTLTATPAKVADGAKAVQHVKLTVTDAGDPVAGATVKLGGDKGTTGKGGTVRLDVPAGAGRGVLRAVARRTGYVEATATVRVR